MKKMSALACAAVGMLFAMSLAACGSSTPSQVVDSSLAAIKGQDSQALSKYYSGDASEISGGSLSELGAGVTSEENMTENEKAVYQDLVKKMLDFDYKVGSEKVDGDTATVEVAFKSYDIGSAFSLAFQEYLSKAISMALAGTSTDEITEMFYQELDADLNALSEKSKETTTTISLTKTDGQWKVDALSPEAIDAISGGLYTAANALSAS